MFAYYYTIVPIIDLAIIEVIYEKKLLFRLIFAFISIIITINLFIVNTLLSIIVSESHNCQPFLYSLIARKRLSLKIKFKILSLIERLSGPVIGIYCYQLFPFTNYEFYLFLVNCVLNFTLFIRLVEV